MLIIISQDFLARSDELMKLCLSAEKSANPSETLKALTQSRRAMLECSVYALKVNNPSGSEISLILKETPIESPDKV